MKTFLNVLYRRILYKIPLKLLLVLIAVFGILFACFSSAEFFSFTESDFYYKFTNAGTYNFTNSDNNYYCFYIDARCSNCGTLTVDGVSHSLNGGRSNSYDGHGYTYCANGTNISYTSSQNGYFYFIFSDYFGNSLYPQYTSLECQTEYNLIPISSVDQNYCTTNNLCPSCPVCPVGTGGVSTVYINDVLHIGAPYIYMNISDELDWDYAYTQGGNNMNIDVVGYNVDYDKISDIIDNQNYKPSSEDLANILGVLGPYTKIIVFFVFLFLVWAWIKKPFKSKKL